jgi:signal transduction histidine kinase
MVPRLTTPVRLQQAVFVAALVVPALLFGAAIWQNRRDVTREGHDMIARTGAVMQEHARKVFETAELTIGRVDDRVDDESWDVIAEPGTSAFLRRLKAPMDQLVSVWVADADGTVRAGSQPWAAGGTLAPRDFFQGQKAAPIGLAITGPFTGVATGTPSFAIIRRRTTPDGRFDGTIHAAISPAYFTRFYAEIAPPGEHMAALLLANGTLLARQPADPGQPILPEDSASREAIRVGTLNGVQDVVGAGGMPLVIAVRKVGAYPAYVVFAVPRAALLKRWYRNVSIYGAVAAAAALTLLGVSYLALRRAQAEQDALIRLEEASRQRLAAEQRLRHSQRMDAVGQLTGGVAHDFNNLLTAILGNLELMQRVPAMAGVTPEAAARIQRLTATAMKAVQRGAALTKSLLAFSRKQPLQPRPLDANALLLDFMDLVRQAVGQGIEVSFQPADTLPPCLSDPAELEAAVLNLAINARDAMNGTGQFRLRTTAVALDAAALAGNTEARPGTFVAIEVADTGPGMTPDVAAKAFEPFFTTKPVGQGTGLGLSQVYGFVRQLGGHVTLGSAPGQGAVITLYLPAVVS